ncbi:MAG: Holliday junction branch migration protein RuvA [Spirochaetaceae bacterium]|nr:Holliday junction branch migration protein RuvA [Spirochaetaceae bacterium]
MFNSICGVINGKFPQQVLIQTGGRETGFIEWSIQMPESSVNMLPALGETARVFTWTYHHEDAMKLFGFASEDERTVFLDLIKVEGVGPKAAVKILSNVNARQLAAVLDDGDLPQLEKIPGVGKKTAQKMLLALKGKLSLSDDSVAVVHKKAISPWQDVVLALVNMGYEKHAVEELVEKLSQNMDAGLTKKEQEDRIFRQAIVELAN